MGRSCDSYAPILRGSTEYLDLVQSPIMPANQHLDVRQSRLYELKDKEDRVEALKLVIGLARYGANKKDCRPTTKALLRVDLE